MKKAHSVAWVTILMMLRCHDMFMLLLLGRVEDGAK